MKSNSIKSYKSFFWPIAFKNWICESKYSINNFCLPFLFSHVKDAVGASFQRWLTSELKKTAQASNALEDLLLGASWFRPLTVSGALVDTTVVFCDITQCSLSNKISITKTLEDLPPQNHVLICSVSLRLELATVI